MKIIKKYKRIIIIGLGVLILISLGYLGLKKYQIYQIKQTEKEKQTQEAFSAQQKALENAQQEIDKLKTESEQSKNKQNTLEKQISQGTNKLANNKIDLASIIKEWEPRIAYITCEFNSFVQSGSGLLFGDLGGSQRTGHYLVLTNSHVISDQGHAANLCKVNFFNQNEEIIIKNPLEETFRFIGLDAGMIKLPYVNGNYSPFPSAYDLVIGLKRCNLNKLYGSKKAPIGEEVVVLGYPSIGSQNGITATEGIISGYDEDYYITSAKVEHGNSGGVAILLKDDCYLGIPSFVVAGSIESLARILDINAIILPD